MLKKLTIILIASLSFNIALADSQGNAYKQAADKALQAFYIQSGLKQEWGDPIQKNLADYAKTWNNEYVPDYLQKPGAFLFIALKAINDHELVCRWTF